MAFLYKFKLAIKINQVPERTPVYVYSKLKKSLHSVAFEALGKEKERPKRKSSIKDI